MVRFGIFSALLILHFITIPKLIPKLNRMSVMQYYSRMVRPFPELHKHTKKGSGRYSSVVVCNVLRNAGLVFCNTFLTWSYIA